MYDKQNNLITFHYFTLENILNNSFFLKIDPIIYPLSWVYFKALHLRFVIFAIDYYFTVETQYSCAAYKNGRRQNYITFDNDGNIISKFYFNFEGDYHNEDGPAAKLDDGTTYWMIHGNLHREDGPAVTTSLGRTEWWNNGQLHREDGPAFRCPIDGEEWWINGVLLSGSEVEHHKMKLLMEKKINVFS